MAMFYLIFTAPFLEALNKKDGQKEIRKRVRRNMNKMKGDHDHEDKDDDEDEEKDKNTFRKL